MGDGDDKHHALYKGAWFPGEWMEIMQYNIVHAEVPDIKSDFVRHGSSYKAKFC